MRTASRISARVLAETRLHIDILGLAGDHVRLLGLVDQLLNHLHVQLAVLHSGGVRAPRLSQADRFQEQRGLRYACRKLDASNTMIRVGKQSLKGIGFSRPTTPCRPS